MPDGQSARCIRLIIKTPAAARRRGAGGWAGSSGAQIATELLGSGRKVYLSIGPHDRPPRSYRGKDFVWWLGALGKWQMQTPPLGKKHVTIAVSGVNGGETVDFRKLADRGMILLGRTEVMKWCDLNR